MHKALQIKTSKEGAMEAGGRFVMKEAEHKALRGAGLTVVGRTDDHILLKTRGAR